MTFSALQDKDFFGRQDDQAVLAKRIIPANTGIAQSAVLSGPPGIGKTELLKQFFGYLFLRQDRVAPFFFVVNPALLSAAAFSKTYLSRFLCQRIAFDAKEQSLVYRDDITLDGLYTLADARGAAWAKELLEQYEQSADDPVNALRLALSAPHRSALMSGKPVVVLIDEFHRLKGLSIDGTPDPRLVSLFEEPMLHSNTTHIITGCAAELLEMPVTNVLERIPVHPLGSEAVSARALFLLRSYKIEGTVPPTLLRHLGGNPFYLDCVVRTAGAKKSPSEMDFWNAYAQEVIAGALAFFWSSTLKSYFPDLERRRIALAITHKIYHANESLSCPRIAKAFSVPENQAESLAHTLYLAGVIRGEYGLFHAVEDSVLCDIIDCLYLREVLGRPPRELFREFLDNLLAEKRDQIRFDMTLPMAREAELVAAQCLEQIGKNLHINQDALGQFQIALIEACLNAKEFGEGAADEIHVSVAAGGDQLEVSVECAGQEFIVQETGEPFGDRDSPNAPGRGWGIRLMKRFADDVRFEKTARGVKTVLIKKLDQSSIAPTEDAADHKP